MEPPIYSEQFLLQLPELNLDSRDSVLQALLRTEKEAYHDYIAQVTRNILQGPPATPSEKNKYRSIISFLCLLHKTLYFPEETALNSKAQLTDHQFIAQFCQSDSKVYRLIVHTLNDHKAFFFGEEEAMPSHFPNLKHYSQLEDQCDLAVITDDFLVYSSSKSTILSTLSQFSSTCKFILLSKSRLAVAVLAYNLKLLFHRSFSPSYFIFGDFAQESKDYLKELNFDSSTLEVQTHHAYPKHCFADLMMDRENFLISKMLSLREFTLSEEEFYFSDMMLKIQFFKHTAKNPEAYAPVPLNENSIAFSAYAYVPMAVSDLGKYNPYLVSTLQYSQLESPFLSKTAVTEDNTI